MDRQLLSVIGIGVFVVLLVAGIFVVQSGWLSGQTQGRKAIADKYGWTYSENEEGTLWRIRGTTQGVAWVCDAAKPRRGVPREQDRPHRTRFSAALPGSGVYVGPKIPEGPAGAVVTALIAATRAEATEAVENGRVLPVPGALGERLEARVTDDATWRALQGKKLQAFEALSQPRPWPVMLVWQSGELSLTAGEAIVDPATVESFIQGSLQVAF